MKKLLTLLLPVAMAIASCESDTYDSGDGRYSYLRADFVLAHTATSKYIDYATADDDSHIALTRNVGANWATAADTLYRALLYYNAKPEGNEPILLQRVHVLRPRVLSDNQTAPKDPVTFESAWRSANGQWLNVAFFIKSGQTDDAEALQSIGMQQEQMSDGTICLTLLHDQSGVPQYYSTRIYASIPLNGDLRSAPLRLVVNTAEGPVVRNFTP